MRKLDAIAASGAEAEMEPLCTNLTFDIIGDVVCNLDLKAQDDSSGGHEVVYYFRQLLATFVESGKLLASLNVRSRVLRKYYASKVDASIKKSIQDSFADIKAAQNTESKDSKNRSVLSLALKDVDELTSEDLQVVADQVKTFFFAGHDTTSILLQRLFHEISVNPRCLGAIRAEHDVVFGDSDPCDVFLSEPDQALKQLTYTSACIKEALRLWPPASSARMSVPEKGCKVRLDDGSEVCIDGTVLYLNHFLIQRDPKVYGDSADEFVPERWLGNTSTAAADTEEQGVDTGDQNIPVSAWRPFERGPRNCIGQELANLEARVIITCALRKYDFVKVGAGAALSGEDGKPMLDEKGRYKTNAELFNVSA
jgi:cytochrome P450